MPHGWYRHNFSTACDWLTTPPWLRHFNRLIDPTSGAILVPELASRDHVKRMLPLIRQMLAEADCVPTEPR